MVLTLAVRALAATSATHHVLAPAEPAAAAKRAWLELSLVLLQLSWMLAFHTGPTLHSVHSHRQVGHGIRRPSVL